MAMTCRSWYTPNNFALPLLQEKVHVELTHKATPKSHEPENWRLGVRGIKGAFRRDIRGKVQDLRWIHMRLGLDPVALP